MELLTWFALFIALVCTLYWYLNRPYTYWEKLGIPSAPTVPLFGSQLAILRKSFQEIDTERYRKYGRIFGQYEGMKPTLMVADPELLKNIFVKDFQYFVNRRSFITGNPLVDNMVSVMQGEKWKRVRALMTPAFSTGKIRKMTSIILDSAKMVCQNFKTAAETNTPADMKRLFGTFTMDVIASTAFATKVDSHNDPNNIFVSTARKAFGTSISFSMALFFMFPKLSKFIRPNFFSQEVMGFFKTVALRIIEERKRTRQYCNDFLQLMMEAAGEVETSSTDNIKDEQDKENETEYETSFSQKGMSHDELVAQCVIFFIAGYETTAATISFASYNLALNPDCQERLIQEIDEMLSKNKGEITYEGVQSLKYLDSVICETLRIFPPGVRIEREALDDYDLGYADLKIPKGMIIGVPVYAIHHDPEFYPDPEKFDPDRFTAEAKAERNPYTYLPFGVGPRNCLGMRFALMEIKICLAQFFSQFRVKRCSKTKVPLEFHPSPSILMAKSIILGVEERADKNKD